MFKSEKPHSAITVLIERLTKEEYDVDDLSDLPTLIEAIRLQRSTGPTEAARAIRKKLKYGNPHRQLRALTILDDLIQNTGTGFQRQFADEPLLERLRYIVRDPAVDEEVKTKCQGLYRQWAHVYKDTPGMQNIATLYKQLPQRKRLPNKETSKVLRETERFPDDDDESPFKDAGGRRPSLRGSEVQQGPTVTPVTKKDKKLKGKRGAGDQRAFSFDKEKPRINTVITQATIESTGLNNALKLVNRETQRVSDHPEVRRKFESCKALRKETFRYCSLVMDEGYLGTLLSANDQLSDALILYEQLDKSFDYDSDSEDYEGGGDASLAWAARRASASPTTAAAAMGNLSIASTSPPPQSATRSQFSPKKPSPPPAPAVTSPTKGKQRAPDPVPDEDEDDDDDPFGDSHAVDTPSTEKKGMNWRDI